MGTKPTLAGMEVPIIGSDSVSWIDLPIPSSSTPSSLPFAPLSANYASCSFAQNPATTIIWRIQKCLPNALELQQLFASNEFPKTGIRLLFNDSLCPFAFVCKNEITSSSGCPYLLYALTVSGVAYVFKLRNVLAYASCSVFPQDEFIELDLRGYGNNNNNNNNANITAVAATLGCLVVGRNDGSVGCFQLGKLDRDAPGFVHELRDDSGIGRIWGFVSRARMVEAVKDLVISELHGRKLMFVLHADQMLRVWDLSNGGKIFSHTIGNSTLTGAMPVKLWIGEVNQNACVISLAVLYRQTLEVTLEMIHIFGIHFSLGDRVILSSQSSVRDIPLGEDLCVDVKLTSDKIWILKESGLLLQDLIHSDVHVEDTRCYAMHEEFVAEQLFQSYANSFDDFLCIIHSIFSSSKDRIVSFVSSIFLRRLLHPGVHHSIALAATLRDYNRHLSDSEFQSLTVDGLKKEIASLIETEAASNSPVSTFYCWKTFCDRYFHHWCNSNTPYGLLVNASGVIIGLIRKNCMSLFRGLENIEQHIDGSSEEIGYLSSSGFESLDDGPARDILFEFLKCIISISQQLGRTASSIYYELLVNPSVSLSEEFVPRLLKIMEAGHTLSVQELESSDLGTDPAWEKGLVDHKKLRKFSVDMLFSLHTLHEKAVTWGKVLDVIESYLQFLVPRKVMQRMEAKVAFNIDTSITVQATSQISKVMFESAFEILLFLSYLVNKSQQIHMLHDDISRIQLELVPMIEEIICEWLIIHFFCATPSELPATEDFSFQMSSLQIDNFHKMSGNKKLGNCDFTLAVILLLNVKSSLEDQDQFSSRFLPSPCDIVYSVQAYASWVIWGRTGENSFSFLSHSTELALILLRHAQYNAVEFLLRTVEAHSQKERTSSSIQDTDSEWCVLYHLLGCCLLAQAHCRPHGMLKEKNVSEAVRFFFRASSGQEASKSLQSLSHELGLSHLGFSIPSGFESTALWKLHYYQWAMQTFEQYCISDGACQFALAALEQVDEALSHRNNVREDLDNESATTIKGRLWANVFKFTLDLNHFYDAYCAIISNPDEENKYICLRRFIIVLYERGAIKILCDGQLPFIGLTEKVERELSWKAECSDVFAKPNAYKLLYAFEMHRYNWRRAAGYIYLYSTRLKAEASLADHPNISWALQERLNALSAAINALHLVHPTYAWIDLLLGGNDPHSKHYPSKKAKRTLEEQSADHDVWHQGLQAYVDIEKLENEFILTSAEYLLSLANVKWTFNDIQKAPSGLVDLLVQTNLYDMAFTVLLRFWKGSRLERELERVFIAMSLKCCPSLGDSLDVGTQSLLLTSSKDESTMRGSPKLDPTYLQFKGNNQWETLELYLEKYKAFHARLPVVVAETLLRTDPYIELPLWLVHMFKSEQTKRTWGMAGHESSPASLFQLYVDYGRYVDATNLLLESLDLYASVRPSDLINRKKPFAAWFPYTIVERLWCRLEELSSLGHMADQCERLKKLLRDGLLSHLKLLKVDSDDALCSAAC